MIDQKFLESLGVTDESAVQKITEVLSKSAKGRRVAEEEARGLGDDHRADVRLDAADQVIGHQPEQLRRPRQRAEPDEVLGVLAAVQPEVAVQERAGVGQRPVHQLGQAAARRDHDDRARLLEADRPQPPHATSIAAMPSGRTVPATA